MAKRVIRCNRTAHRHQRFDGLCFDVEPYLLQGFSGPAKGAILREYLGLFAKLQRVAKSARLQLGADIPSWLDGLDRYQQPIARVGGRPVSELIMDRVDNVAIMAYRTSVYGPDGVIAHTIDEVEYAERTGKGIYIGLETGASPDERVQEFVLSGDRDSERIVLWSEGRERFRITRLAASETRALSKALKTHPDARVLNMRFESLAPASKVSFDGEGLSSLGQAIERISEEFGFHSATRGVALHGGLRP
ncbi:MAG: hypothetical protein GY811_02085 [Myxococcales bacterium]|nr:hypothetical protein [Myxococcales bacterium]